MAQITLNSTGVASSGSLVLQTNGTTTAATIDTAQNFGLGVTPSAWNTFNAIQMLGGGISIASGSGQSYMGSNWYFASGNKYYANGYATRYDQTSGAHAWQIAASGTAGNAITFTQAMTLTAAGDLGIGTTSPASVAGYKLIEVQGSTGGIFQTSASGNSVKARFYSTNIQGYAGTTSNHPFAFLTNDIERVTIDTSGNLLVGATSGVVGGERLSISSGSQRGAVLKNSSSGSELIGCWNSATTGDNGFAIFWTEASPTQRGSITYNRAGGLTVYATTSDYRAKDIIGPVTNSGALIDSIPVYIGKMKWAEQERPMFIAHETPAYAHTGEKDAVDADGKPVYQQMDASALIPVMWAEIQSLRKRLAALESA